MNWILKYDNELNHRKSRNAERAEASIRQVYWHKIELERRERPGRLGKPSEIRMGHMHRRVQDIGRRTYPMQGTRWSSGRWQSDPTLAINGECEPAEKMNRIELNKMNQCVQTEIWGEWCENICHSKYLQLFVAHTRLHLCQNGLAFRTEDVSRVSR